MPNILHPKTTRKHIDEISPDFIVDNLNRVSDQKRLARNSKGNSTRDLTNEINDEAMRPVRKSENGRYGDMPLENLDAAGNDEDGDSLKKKK